MKRTTPNKFLKEERKNTDESLGAERVKANVSLEKSRDRTETATDEKVQEERDRADRFKEKERDKIDARLDDSVDEDQLQNERDRSDKALVRARSASDDAMEQEREVKLSLAEKLFKQERERTDKNLSAERTRTDSEVSVATNRLSVEKAAHTVTQGSLATREELLAIVSHDLKNPIGAASSCAEMLFEDSEYELNSKTRNWIEFIKRNNDAALKLINDLLDSERFAQGKLMITFEKHKVDSIVRESIERFTLTASAKSILIRAVPSQISGSIYCDKDRIVQAISNLIGNALKFTEEGGSITVESNLTESELQITVRDTGCGIPEDKIAHIFERFAQLKSNDRRGLGLGLYITKMLVEAHHGKLSVKSKVGEGSAFYFTIPTKQST